MKFLKNNLKVIIAFMLGVILTGGIVYATVVASAGDITYTTSKNSSINNVASALNDLYSRNKTRENAMWLIRSNQIGRCLINLEDGTAIKMDGTTTIGNKIKLQLIGSCASIDAIALQTGKFKITIVSGDGDVSVEEKNVTAGEKIVTGTSISYGIVEALF